MPKGFRLGTHRSDGPETLLRALMPELPRFGITRVARLTGLDRIGIEVFAVCRPNARGLSVSQGKGCSADAARLSGIMEAIELRHAEHPKIPLFFASPAEVESAVEQSALSQLLGEPLRDMPIYWTDAVDLETGALVSIPFDLVHACFVDGARTNGARFPISTNGLASGANLAEALTHALCELIERHETVCLGRLHPAERAGRMLDLRSVDDASVAELIDRFTAANLSVKVWNATGPIGIPSFVAGVADRRDVRMPPGFGAGTHPSTAIALARALCEAAQSRLTRISGARDDLGSTEFGASAGVRARWLTEASTPAESDGGCRFGDVADRSSDCLRDDLRRIVAALRQAGSPQILAVDLSTDPRFKVVRAIVPGLLGFEAAA